uniref:Uncharacterized protein n=1 Tax=Cacopsylla melanoneura TaxID=428564 RepID=A0A8D9BTS5_9HEMI
MFQQSYDILFFIKIIPCFILILLYPIFSLSLLLFVRFFSSILFEYFSNKSTGVTIIHSSCNVIDCLQEPNPSGQQRTSPRNCFLILSSFVCFFCFLCVCCLLAVRSPLVSNMSQVFVVFCFLSRFAVVYLLLFYNKSSLLYAPVRVGTALFLLWNTRRRCSSFPMK